MKIPLDNPEFSRFTEAMRKIVSVPKAEVMRRIEEERAHSIKGKRGPKPKTSAFRASGVEPKRAG
ncbi:MAG: hypothetical protein ACLQVM_25955 [Terriglobia bacterium]